VADRRTKSPSLTRSLAIGLVFGFVVILALGLLSDLRQVSARVVSFNWSVYPFVLGLTLFNYTLRFFKWHYYLKLVGVRGLPLGSSARLFVGGFPLSVTPGKVGEALKGVWLNRMTGLAVAVGISVILAERISDGLAVTILSTAGVIAYPQYWPAFAVALTLLLAVMVISQFRPLVLGVLDFADRLPLVSRFSHSLRLFYQGSYTLFKPLAALIAVSLGTISWLGEGIGFYLILLGLGVPPGWQVLSVAIFTLSFSTLVGAASTLPGGLGAAEASIAGMLTLLLGLPPDLSAAATLLIRFATLWFGVGLGLVVWAFSPQMIGLESKPAGLENELPESSRENRAGSWR
jgi:uncharacterized protein (TIRG00374 family)